MFHIDPHDLCLFECLSHSVIPCLLYVNNLSMFFYKYTEIRRCTLKPHSCFTTFLPPKKLEKWWCFSSLVKSIYQVPQLHPTTPQSLRLRPYDSYDQGLWKPMKGISLKASASAEKPGRISRLVLWRFSVGPAVRPNDGMCQGVEGKIGGNGGAGWWWKHGSRYPAICDRVIGM